MGIQRRQSGHTVVAGRIGVADWNIVVVDDPELIGSTRNDLQVAQGINNRDESGPGSGIRFYFVTGGRCE